MEIKVGDKVIGMEGWNTSYKVGIVLNTDMTFLDPIHKYLINTNPDKKIVVANRSDYDTQINSIRGDIEFVYEKTICPYKKSSEKRLSAIIRLLDSKSGQVHLNRQETIYSFFQRNNSAFGIRTVLYWRIFSSATRSFLSQLFIGTTELALGDLFRFYKNRNELLKLKSELRQRHRDLAFNKRFSGFSRQEKEEARLKIGAEIEDLENQIQNISQSSTESSRSFLAFTVALVGLIIAGAQLVLFFNQTALLTRHYDLRDMVRSGYGKGRWSKS